MLLEAIQHSDDLSVHDLMTNAFKEGNIDVETLEASIQFCLERIEEKEWFQLLSTVLYDRSHLLSESMLSDVLDRIESVVEVQPRLGIITMGHIAVGLKLLPILTRVLNFLKKFIVNGEYLAPAFKSLCLVTNESPKMANEVIATLLPFLHEHIVKSPLARTRSITLDSDSEYSDLDPKRRLRPEWKVQQQALLCLESLARVKLVHLAIIETNAFAVAEISASHHGAGEVIAGGRLQSSK
jgi:hypothetical protein